MKNKLREVRYEDLHETVDYQHTPSIFLAGPTVRGHQPHLTSWRFDAVKLLIDRGFKGNVIIPEFLDKKESDKYRYDIPEWEFEGLRKCHVILFWLPRTRELIGLTTNWEHGYWVARKREKMVYGRPDNAYRINYIDVMWAADARDRQEQDPEHKYVPCPIYNTLEKTVDAALKHFAPWSLVPEPTGKVRLGYD
jgi:nucleoside 2-deoxyribosyltransferase